MAVGADGLPVTEGQVAEEIRRFDEHWRGARK